MKLEFKGSREDFARGGLYIIECAANGRIYIGNTIKYRRRRKEHATDLNCRVHKNSQMAKDWHEFGGDTFSMTPLRIAEESSKFTTVEEMAVIQAKIKEMGRSLVYNEVTTGEPMNPYRAYKHGMTGTPEYGAWKKFKSGSMPNLPRGLSTFSEFYAAIGEKPKGLARVWKKSQEKPWGPQNIRWIQEDDPEYLYGSETVYTIDGVSKSVSDWARHHEIDITTVWSRILRGKSIEQALKKGSYRTRLTEPDVIEIRERYAAGESRRSLKESFGIGEATLHNMVSGVSWKNAGGPITKGKRAIAR